MLLSSAVSADLEWKVVYVGSADSTDLDQVLNEVLVGPVPVGMNRFVLEVSSIRQPALLRGRW